MKRLAVILVSAMLISGCYSSGQPTNQAGWSIVMVKSPNTGHCHEIVFMPGIGASAQYIGEIECPENTGQVAR